MVRNVLAASVAAAACLAAAPGALGANITLTPEADTFVRASDPDASHGVETSFDVHGGASFYGCGTGPSVGLLRFDLSSIPAGATITSAKLELTSFTGFAFDGDPEHHASFVPDDSWAEGSVTWNTRPADGLVPQAPPAEWLLFGSPLSTSPANLGAASAFDSTGCFGTTSTNRTFTSANLGTRVGAERAGDGKLSVEVFTIACGTPFAVVCQNGQLEQSYFLRYYSKEQSLLNAPRLIVEYTAALAVPSLIQVVSTGGTGAFVIGRVDGASNLPLTLTASTAATCTAGALPGGGTPTGGPVSVTTDAAGYFSAAVTGVTPGDFVTVEVTAPSATGPSPCLVSSGDNDFWPKALALTGSTRRHATSSTRPARHVGTSSPSLPASASRSGSPAFQPTTTWPCSRTSARRSPPSSSRPTPPI